MMNTTPNSYLSVDGGHQLYYEIFGNPDGIPVLFLHGGPGLGFLERDKSFFNPQKFKVLFYDQRGSGRSTPFGSVQNNNIDCLVDDINTLTEKVGFKKFHVFGGSWGSTLALVYAIRNPERVLSLILRGIFLGNREAIEHYLNGGVKSFYPEVWKRFIQNVPNDFEGHPTEYYYKIMAHGEEEQARKLAYEWYLYESSIVRLAGSEEQVDEIEKSGHYRSLSLLEAHYLTHHCFLPENYILNNLKVLENTLVWIVNGRYDMICPPRFAFQLAENLKNARLYIEIAGHSASEPKIKKRLIQILEKLSCTKKN